MKKHISIAVALVLLSEAALAAGGLQAASTATTEFKTWLYALIGITSIVYLLFQGAMVKMQKKTWGDFGMAAVWVAVLGGIPALAAFMWEVFA